MQCNLMAPKTSLRDWCRFHKSRSWWRRARSTIHWLWPLSTISICGGKRREPKSKQLGQQFLVGLVFLERADERLHGFDRIEVTHHAPQFPHPLDLILREKVFLLARAALGTVDGGNKTAIGQFTI